MEKVCRCFNQLAQPKSVIKLLGKTYLTEILTVSDKSVIIQLYKETETDSHQKPHYQGLSDPFEISSEGTEQAFQTFQFETKK